MYNKTIIGFNFCDTQNYQSLSKSWLELSAFGLADNSYMNLNIDNSACHKNLIQ